MDIPDLVRILEQSAPEDLMGSDDIGWAIAQSFSKIRPLLRDQTLVDMAKRIAIKATIRRVLQLLGPVSIPSYLVRTEYQIGEDAEIDVEATLDQIVEKNHIEPSDVMAGLLVAAGLALRQQWLIRGREPAACFRAFLNNNLFGLAVFAGILLHYLFAG